MTMTDFYLLVIAIDAPMSGRAAIETVGRASLGRVQIGSATLYRTLTRLHKNGMIDVDQAHDTYKTTDQAIGEIQSQVDLMRDAVGFAMQTGYFFT